MEDNKTTKKDMVYVTPSLKEYIVKPRRVICDTSPFGSSIESYTEEDF